MPTFIPPYLGEEIKSTAEKKMYEILQDMNLKNSYILHSLGLPKHQSKIYGEIDFVVVCEYGIACLEIKGGRVECIEGKWIFTDRNNIERVKAEGPFAQVTGNMFSLKEVIKKRYMSNQRLKNILVASGVIFPDIEFKSISQEIIPEIIYDKKTEDITSYIVQIFDYWKNRQHRDIQNLTSIEIKDIVNYLRGEFSFIPSLGDRLESVEKKLIRLTSEQSMLMDALSLNERLLIEGNAGSGKTLLALDFAKKKAINGEKVIYLAFNKNLTNSVINQIGIVQNLKIVNIHALLGEFVEIDIIKLNKNPQKYFSETLPNDFYSYLSSLDKESIESVQYDQLVIDEGQDILKPNLIYCLELLLKNGLEKGKWAIFYDEKQNIYNPEYQDGIELLSSLNFTRFRLQINCRNTVQIGKYSADASGIDLKEFIRENGEEVQKISYRDNEDFKKKVSGIMKNFTKEKIKFNDVVFLSPKKYDKSLLSLVGIKVNEINENIDESIDLPIFATIQGFKGLDSKVVVLVDVDEILENNFSKYIYISATRARTLLYIIGTNDFWKKH